MFVLVGQVLNSRAQLRPDDVGADRQQRDLASRCSSAYLLAFGPAAGREQSGALLRGPGAAARSRLDAGHRGAAAGPGSLPASGPGSRYRPRFDFRGTGLGHTLRLGVWTVLFVIVNQIAYTIVVRIASSGTAQAATGRHDRHRLHDLLQRLPGDDGPARHRHGVAGDRDAAAALRGRRRARPARARRGVASMMRTAYA